MGRGRGVAFRLLIIFVISVVSAAPAFSKDSKIAIGDAFLTLKNARQVESSVVGEAAASSRLVQAYAIIKSSNDSADLFAKLNRESRTNAGKVYAMMWFFSHDRDSYLKVKASLRGNERVKVMIGCVIRTLSMKEIFGEIEAGNLIDQLQMNGLKR